MAAWSASSGSWKATSRVTPPARCDPRGVAAPSGTSRSGVPERTARTGRAPRPSNHASVVASPLEGYSGRRDLRIAATTRRLQQPAGRGRGEGHAGGEQQAGPQALGEGRRLGKQGAEDGHGEGAPDLAAGVEHAAGRAGLVAGDAVEQDRGRWWGDQGGRPG